MLNQISRRLKLINRKESRFFMGEELRARLGLRGVDRLGPGWKEWLSPHRTSPSSFLS